MNNESQIRFYSEQFNDEVEPLIKKFSSLYQLTQSEIDALRNLHKNLIMIKGNDAFDNQLDRFGKCIILNQGWACRSYNFANGKRQIINFYLPGDIINPYGFVTPKKSYTIASISSIEAFTISFDLLSKLLTEQPRLGSYFEAMLAREDNMIAGQISRLGFQSASQRTLHFLLEIFHRLRLIGQSNQYTFSTPFTQQLMADTLGLSLVHMNRTLHKLQKDNLIKIDSKKICLLDFDKITQLAEYQDFYQ